MLDTTRRIIFQLKQYCGSVWFKLDNFYQEGITHLVPHSLPTLLPGFEFGGKRLEDLEALGGPLGVVFPLSRAWGAFGWGIPPPPGLLAHLGCTSAIGAQWVAPLSDKKRLQIN